MVRARIRATSSKSIVLSLTTVHYRSGWCFYLTKAADHGYGLAQTMVMIENMRNNNTECKQKRLLYATLAYSSTENSDSACELGQYFYSCSKLGGGKSYHYTGQNITWKRLGTAYRKPYYILARTLRHLNEVQYRFLGAQSTSK